jgi:hypothetical protein
MADDSDRIVHGQVALAIIIPSISFTSAEHYNPKLSLCY